MNNCLIKASVQNSIYLVYPRVGGTSLDMAMLYWQG